MPPSQWRPVSIHLCPVRLLSPLPPLLPLQPSILFLQRRYMSSTAPTDATTSSPHLCCAVSNVIVLTPAVCVYVGESCWVCVISTPSSSLPFSLLCLPAGQWCPMHRRWAVTAYLSCLTHWPAKNRLNSTVCNWYTHSNTCIDIYTCLGEWNAHTPRPWPVWGSDGLYKCLIYLMQIYKKKPPGDVKSLILYLQLSVKSH